MRTKQVLHTVGERSIDFYPHCFNNPETVAESEQNQHNDICGQRIILSAWASAKSDQSSSSTRRKFGSLVTHKVHSEDSDQTGRMLRLIVFLSGRTDHLVDFCHAPAYFHFPLTIISLKHLYKKICNVILT